MTEFRVNSRTSSLPSFRGLPGLLWVPLMLANCGCLTNQAIGHHLEWRKIVAEPEESGLQSELIRFTSTDRLVLTAWWLAADGAAKGTVVLAHGQGGNRSDMLGRAAFLVHAGYNVLAIDLRAHGESDGNYMTPGFKEAEDVLSAVAYVRGRGEVGPIVLLGYSYGAVAVLHAASRSTETSAVVADAAFISQKELMHRVADYVRNNPQASWVARLGIGMVKWPGVLWLCGVEFYLRTGVNLNSTKVDAIEAVGAIRTTPVLFLAGESDPIAPAANTERMFEATLSPRKRIIVLPKATHSTYTTETKDAYEAAVLDFLEWAIGQTSKAGRPNGFDRFDRHAQTEAPDRHDLSEPRP